mgnify:CR=1 FL=1
MGNDQEINIDNALSLLNSQISKFEKKVKNQIKRNSYILHDDLLGNKTYDVSEHEDDDFEDEDDVILDMNFNKQIKNSTIKPFDLHEGKNESMQYKNPHKLKSSLSFRNNGDFFKDEEHNIEHDNLSSLGRKDQKANPGLFSTNNEHTSSTFKYMPNISRSNVKRSNGGNGYLDSSYGPFGTSSSSASSPFINQSANFGGSTGFSTNTSPFNKQCNTENSDSNSSKKPSLMSQNSFKRTNSLKRSNSLKKYTNNLNLYLTNNNIGISNGNNNMPTKNQPMINLQSKIEEAKQEDDYLAGMDKQKRKGSISKESEVDTLEFFSKQPPPHLNMPYRNTSSSGSSNMVPLSSSNTGSSLYSSGSNQLGLLSIKDNENKSNSMTNDAFAFNRDDLNKTPVVSLQGHNTLLIDDTYTHKKLPPKTPDRTNDLLYKLNTDMNFEAESIEVMSAMSQNSFGSASLNASASMMFNKNDLVKMSEFGNSNMTLSEGKSQSQHDSDGDMDQALKRIIHLPVINTKLEYNQDGIALLNSDELVNLIIENEKTKNNDLVIIDCRFPREFNEGHIINSLNIYDFDGLFEFMKHVLMSDRSKITQFKIVFYCEFSQYRSPKLSKFVRKLDRLVNIKYWPYLIYPDLFILNGGIYKFQENNMNLITGQYKSMSDSYRFHNDELDDHLSVFRKQVSCYLGEDSDAAKKNKEQDTFDRMVFLKNDLMKCIEK